MKSKKTELNVDVIGGQGSLTAAEEKAISELIKQRKLASQKIRKRNDLKLLDSYSKL
ncbi:MAG: hypothetical protein WCH52_10545 [Bacteroidota bacterium]